MKSIALALATLSFASAPAMAGVYVNAESRDGYTGSDYTGRTVDLHIGYEGNVGKLGGAIPAQTKALVAIPEPAIAYLAVFTSPTSVQLVPS